MRKSFAVRVLGILLAIFAMHPSVAFAVNQTWFVNTDCADPSYSGYAGGFQGNGSLSTCATSAGTNGAYLTLGHASTNITQNLVTNTITAFIDLRGALDDTSTPNFAGITSNATFSLTVFTQFANRHPGYFDDSKYSLHGGGNPVFNIGTKFTTVSGLQIISNGTNNGVGNHGINWVDTTLAISGGTFVVANNLVIKTGSSTAASFGIIFNPSVASSSATQVYIFNNGIGTTQSSTSRYHFGVRCVAQALIECRVHENTVRNSDSTGLQMFLSAVNAGVRNRSNLIQGSGTADYSLTQTAAGALDQFDNVTSDATSPNVPFRNRTAIFGPFGVTDFRLGMGDTSSVDQCANIASSVLNFTNDFVGTERGASLWDCGANERIGAGPSAVRSFLSLGVGL